MNEEQKFIERARLSLDTRADSLEPDLAAQLRAARRNALSAHRRTGRGVWMPALAAASLAAVFVGVLWFGIEENGPSPGVIQTNVNSSATDFELLTSSEDLELYERLDFYYWLEQRNTSAG